MHLFLALLLITADPVRSPVIDGQLDPPAVVETVLEPQSTRLPKTLRTEPVRLAQEGQQQAEVATFLYQVAVGVAVAVLSTLLLRAIL